MKYRTRRPARAAAFLLCASLLTGCGAESGQVISVDTDSEEEQGSTCIGIVFDNFINERWERDRDIFVSTAEDLGADVIVGNGNGDVAEQKRIIDHMIDKDVQVLVIVATDCDSLSESVKKAHDAGIKVISYDRIIKNADTDLYITFDNETIGRLMARSINEALPDGGTYIKVNGSETDNNVTLVNEGFDDEIDANMTLIDEVNCQYWNDTEAYDYLTEHPEDVQQADAYMRGNDLIAGQVVRVLAENRKAGQVIVTGQDADLEACQRIVEGTQTMTVYKESEALAGQAAQIAVDMANGGDSGAEETFNDGTYDIPYIDIAPVLVNLDNIDATIIDSGFHTREEVYMHVGETAGVSTSSSELAGDLTE